MPSITFYGATEEVTGSCYLVRGKHTTVLVDCGLFQGERFARAKNYEPLPFACGEIDQVLLTHAHIDHTGRLPKMCLEEFTGKIYATPPTLELTQYLWQDALEIMEIEYQETGRRPLYTPREVANTERFFAEVQYGEKIFLSETDYAIFHNAGHILGSAFIELLIDGCRLVFSGDIGNTNPPLVRETNTLPRSIDFLVCEATYGNRIHEPAHERVELLTEEIKRTIAQKGVLLLPSFAVERTQELLYLLHELNERGEVPTVPIFLDSPLAIKITEVFKHRPEFYNPEHHLLQKHNLFEFPGLRLTPTREKSKEINAVRPPKIIIAGNGMCTGGRIIYHLERYLPDPKNILLIIGYQAAGTVGRMILDGRKWIPILNRSVPVRARVRAIGGFSAHADQIKLLSWIGRAKNLKRIALVHGDADNLKVFALKLKESKIEATIPKYGETITL